MKQLTIPSTDSSPVTQCLKVCNKWVCLKTNTRPESNSITNHQFIVPSIFPSSPVSPFPSMFPRKISLLTGQSPRFGQGSSGPAEGAGCKSSRSSTRSSWIRCGRPRVSEICSTILPAKCWLIVCIMCVYVCIYIYINTYVYMICTMHIMCIHVYIYICKYIYI